MPCILFGDGQIAAMSTSALSSTLICARAVQLWEYVQASPMWMLARCMDIVKQPVCSVKQTPPHSNHGTTKQNRSHKQEQRKMRTSLMSPDDVWTQERSEEHTSELQSRFDLVCRL